MLFERHDTHWQFLRLLAYHITLPQATRAPRLCGDVVGIARAKCLTAIGRTEEGLALHRDATAALRATGVTNPRYLALLADTCRRNAGAGLQGCSPGMGMKCSRPR
jgi:hypothetical protein